MQLHNHKGSFYNLSRAAAGDSGEIKDWRVLAKVTCLQNHMFTKLQLHQHHTLFQTATATPHFYRTATGTTLFLPDMNYNNATFLPNVNRSNTTFLPTFNCTTTYLLYSNCTIPCLPNFNYMFIIFQLHHHMFTKFQPHVYHIPTEPSYVYQIPTALPHVYHNSNCTIKCL